MWLYIRAITPLPFSCIKSATNNSTKTKLIQLQKRFVYRSISSNVRRDANTSKKITASGWFLLIIPTTTFGLGCWQVQRKAWKEQLIKDLEKQANIAAVPLPNDLKDAAEMEYRLVNLRGRFLHDKEILLGPRSYIRPDGEENSGGLFSQRDSNSGYLVITPLKISGSDDIVLVNRGWIPRKQMNPNTRAAGQINDEVEITGIIRSGESRPPFSMNHKGGIYLYRDLPNMCAATGASPVFIDSTYESSIPGGPIGGQTRVTLRNEHLAYSITWFSLSAATAFMWFRQFIKGKPF